RRSAHRRAAHAGKSGFAETQAERISARYAGIHKIVHRAGAGEIARDAIDPLSLIPCGSSAMKSIQHHSEKAGKASTSREPSLLAALDVGSAHVACAVVDVSSAPYSLVALETAASYGIRCGEIVDMARASESIRIAIASAAERANADVRSVVVGVSGDVR